MGEDGRSVKQISHKMPFKKLIWEFSWEANSRNYSQNFLQVSLTCELLGKVAKLSVQSWKTWDLDHLTLSWAYVWYGSRKHPINMFFTQKQLEKLWKIWVIQITSKSKQKEKKNLFGLIHIWLSTHTSHLNMYNHTNEIDIHWTLNLCVVCVDQVWNSL